MTENNAVAIIQPQNIQLIAQDAPMIFTENQTSRQRCVDAGARLLALIQQQGMTEDLDREAATYIEKSRKTLRKLNEKRSPITKIFDEVRSAFTSMETDVDPSKKGSIPYQIQALRNEFAARRRAEEEARRREALIEQQRQQAISKYDCDVRDDYTRLFNTTLTGTLNQMFLIFSNVTLDNYQDSLQRLQDYPTQLPEKSFSASRSMVLLPTNVDPGVLSNIRQQIIDSLLPGFRDKFSQQVSSVRQSYIDQLPSKYAELQRAAQASAAEAEAIRRQVAERDAFEQQQRQQKLADEQNSQRQQSELARQQAEMGDLFATAAASVDTYQPKTSVKKVIEVSAPSGFLAILNLWWVEEGQFLSVDELAKMFKKQVTYAVRLANDKESPRFITDNPAIRYVDDVKAK